MTDELVPVDIDLPGSADSTTTTRLPDLSDVTVEQLLDLESLYPHLAALVRRVLEDADRPQDIVAGFQSAI